MMEKKSLFKGKRESSVRREQLIKKSADSHVTFLKTFLRVKFMLPKSIHKIQLLTQPGSLAKVPPKELKYKKIKSKLSSTR